MHFIINIINNFNVFVKIIILYMSFNFLKQSTILIITNNKEKEHFHKSTSLLFKKIIYI